MMVPAKQQTERTGRAPLCRNAREGQGARRRRPHGRYAIQRDPRAAAFTILEVCIAAGLASLLMAMTLRVLAAAGDRQRAVRHKEVALREAANAMERVASLAWDELDDAARAARLSDEARQTLPGAELSVKIGPPEGQPESRRVVVRISWQGRSGAPPPPVQLVSWRYRSVLGTLRVPSGARR